jgi:hypothetical protein
VTRALKRKLASKREDVRDDHKEELNVLYLILDTTRVIKSVRMG